MAEHTSLDQPAQSAGLRLSLAFLVGYILLAELSHVRPQFGLGITPWSPQTGLLLAWFMRCGRRGLVPGLLAVFLGEYLVGHVPTASISLYLGSAWIAFGYAGLATAMSRLPMNLPPTQARDAAWFAGVAVVGVLVVSAGYIIIHIAAGDLPYADAGGALARYWIANLNGVLVLPPLLAVARQPPVNVAAPPLKTWAFAAAVAVVLGTLAGAFMLPSVEQLRFVYLLFLPIIWIALRWDWRGALFCVLAVQTGLLAVAETHVATVRFIDLQFLMLTLTTTALLLGSVVADRANLLKRTEAKEAEQRALLAMAPDAVLVADAFDRVRLANDAAQRLFRFESNWEDMQLDRLLPQFEGDGDGRAACVAQRLDGSRFPAEVASAKLEAPAEPARMVVVRDVSARIQAEQELRERDAALSGAMRFAVAGEMATALAHELNQPITALVSYLNACEILSGGMTRDDARLRDTLGKSIREAMRASSVLHRLRDFYQGVAPKREPVDLVGTCRRVAEAFAERLQKADAILEQHLDPATPVIEADATQMEIVLHNLVGNALDEVSRSPSGSRRILLELRNEPGAVRIRVEDSGPGVPASMQRRLFDPFVTNKTQGMGLGLAISQSLVQARGGTLSFERGNVLGGAAFTVSLPLAIPADNSAQ